jgi:hypothetical protein
MQRHRNTHRHRRARAAPETEITVTEAQRHRHRHSVFERASLCLVVRARVCLRLCLRRLCSRVCLSSGRRGPKFASDFRHRKTASHRRPPTVRHAFFRPHFRRCSVETLFVSRGWAPMPCAVGVLFWCCVLDKFGKAGAALRPLFRVRPFHFPYAQVCFHGTFLNHTFQHLSLARSALVGRLGGRERAWAAFPPRSKSGPRIRAEKKDATLLVAACLKPETAAGNRGQKWGRCAKPDLGWWAATRPLAARARRQKHMPVPARPPGARAVFWHFC